MFFYLGLKNAWRNRGRTALGIVSMAMAALIFLSNNTLSKGYPAAAFFATRQLLGGDILLIPSKDAISREDIARGDYTWVFRKKSYDSPNLAMGFEPSSYSYGTIGGTPNSQAQISKADRLRQVLEVLQQDSSVVRAFIRRSLPFLAALPPEKGSPAERSFGYGFLDARDVQQDLYTWHLDKAVSSGAYLDPSDRPMVGVACGGWAGLPLPTLGTVKLNIPRFTGKNAPDGSTYLDYESPASVDLLMKGQVSFFEGSGNALRSMSDPVVFVSQSTLSALAQAAGYPEDATCWGISVTLKDMSQLEDVASSLRRQFPDFTVLPASVLESAATSRTGMSTGIPMDMRQVTQVMAFLTAALLSATNLTVLMQNRKNEIGILRALGATRWNIGLMVLTESIWIALLGSIAGSIITQPAIFWQLISNRTGASVLVREAGGGMAKAVGFSVASAAVFGFLPIARALRITPAQVLRGE